MEQVLNDSRLGRFAVAILATVLALVLRLLFEPVAGPAAMWLCFTAGVTIGAWYGGLKPGLVTTSLLTATAVWANETSLPPETDLSPYRWASALFLLLALAICVAMQRLRMERFQSMHAQTQYRSLLESSQEIVLSVDSELRCVYANPRAGQVAKKAPAQILGRSLRTIFPETPGGTLYRELTHVLMNRTPARFEDRLEATKRWYEFEAAPAASGINLFVRDITDLRNAELDRVNKARAREALYSQLNKVVREAPVAVIVVNRDLRVEIANSAAAEIFGGLMEPGAPLASRQPGTMRTSDGAELDPDAWPLRGTILTGEPIVNLELEYQRPDGIRFTLIVNSFALLDATSARSGAVATYSNITSIRDLQRALRASDSVA